MAKRGGGEGVDDFLRDFLGGKEVAARGEMTRGREGSLQFFLVPTGPFS